MLAGCSQTQTAPESFKNLHKQQYRDELIHESKQFCCEVKKIMLNNYSRKYEEAKEIHYPHGGGRNVKFLLRASNKSATKSKHCSNE
ncbi:hypothetical protein T11_1373 [Trichinella zimbabwensis]|uniref:Uncharacterized protein n=1 Tax=Trichinella zimbabwensis TaxID=268475 RepID=A0A0V1HI50_9BILA|nr:hypothetical protein T11_1373 [Trichinella zimbabwensis]